MFELFLIKTVFGQVSIFITCLLLVMFAHHFINFKHILRKSFKLYAFIGVITFVIRIVGNLEKLYWTTKTIKFFFM